METDGIGSIFLVSLNKLFFGYFWIVLLLFKFLFNVFVFCFKNPVFKLSTKK